MGTSQTSRVSREWPRALALTCLVLSLLATSALVGCGRDDMSLNPNSNKFLQIPPKTKYLAIDEEIKSTVQEFVSTAAYYGLDTSVTMDQLREVKFAQGLVDEVIPSSVGGGHINEPGGLLGICERGELTNAINKKVNSRVLFVYLDAGFVGQKETAIFRVLVYHELSHCLLNAEHTKSDASSVVSAEWRLVALLEAAGVMGLPSEAGTNQDMTLFRGLFYPSKILEQLKAQADAAYDVENRAHHHIMSAYFNTDDPFWALNMDDMVEDLFLSLGGKRPSR